MEKDTGAIVEELKNYDDFKNFYQENASYMITENLSQLLEKLLTQTGLKKAQVIKNAELSEVYGYQIFSGLRVPERKKLLALAIGMGLNLEQVQTLLKCAGYSQLYVKLPFDSIILFGICKKMSVQALNELLFRYEMETLG